MAHPESQSGRHASMASGVVSMLSPARKSRVGPTWVASTTSRLSNQTPVSLGNLQPGTRRAPRESWLAPELARGRTPKPLKYGSQDRLATGLLHEGHKRADRSLGGSMLGIPIPVCSMRPASEPTDRSRARRLESQNGAPHEGHRRADRSLGRSVPGNNYRLLDDLRKHLLQPGEL